MDSNNLIVNIIEERIFHLLVKDFCSVTYEDAIEATAILTEYCVENNMNKIGMILVEFGHGATADQAAREYASTKDANNRSNGSSAFMAALYISIASSPFTAVSTEWPFLPSIRPVIFRT